jgi:Type I restriction enzyme R protein N terminus (HSDR_N)
MSKSKDPSEVVATIRESVEASPRKSRKVRFHNLRSKFGWQAWTSQRKDLVAQLLKEQDILAKPPLAEAGLDDWIMLSMPILSDPGTKDPVSRPDDKFFHRLMTVTLGPEREVEIKYVARLFHALDYDDIHEAPGFGFILHEGVDRKHVEADFVYFADENHSVQGSPLILVEAKSAGRKLDAAIEQARSYANILKPMYYVVTNGDVLMVWNYQGPIPDVMMLEFKRGDLKDRFDEVYRLLNCETVTKAREQKITEWTKLGLPKLYMRQAQPGHRF